MKRQLRAATDADWSSFARREWQRRWLPQPFTGGLARVLPYVTTQNALEVSRALLAQLQSIELGLPLPAGVVALSAAEWEAALLLPPETIHWIAEAPRVVAA